MRPSVAGNPGFFICADNTIIRYLSFDILKTAFQTPVDYNQRKLSR